MVAKNLIDIEERSIDDIELYSPINITNFKQHTYVYTYIKGVQCSRYSVYRSGFLFHPSETYI